MANHESSDDGEFSLSAAVVNEKGKYAVLLPCGVKEFGSFVSGLLGKPQVLSGEIGGAFDVGFQEIVSFFHLINHRVEKQNDSSLAHFSISVYYDNGTSITHNDVAKFKDYHPIEDTFPIEIVLAFSYLINFPGKESPEKQTIEVSLAADESSRRERRRYIPGGLFEYRIEYTDRTWATDVAGLLKNHGQSVVSSEAKFKKFLRFYNEEIIYFTSMFAFCVTLICWVSHSYSIIDQTNFDALRSSAGLVKYFVSSVGIIGVLWAVLVMISKWAEYRLVIGANSFITLVDRDNKRKSKLTKRTKRQWAINAFFWFLSIASNMFATYLYTVWPGA